MKKALKFLLLVVVISAATFTGCKKYDEGPMFSLSSKKARLANDWVITKIIVNGTDYTAASASYIASYYLKIEKGGTYTDYFNNVADVPGGTWEFGDKSETLIYDKGTADEETVTILKLKSKEFWISETDGTTTTEVHFEQK